MGVVVAFGMEKTEIGNYSRYLSRVTEAGSKADLSTGMSLGFFMMCIYLSYAYAFTIGGVWVDREFYNHASGRTYSPGDSISVFFTVLFGLFALANAAPNINAITEGKAAGKFAFDVIDRKPVIHQDSMTGNEHKIIGKVEFNQVCFSYPSRQDQTVLNQFSHVFEIGKTTAIVGPSGSGKSTVVQLIERFYDVTGGEILIDDKDLSKLKLRDLRQQIGYIQ